MTVSDEVSGNNSTGRTLAAALDDSWIAGLPNGAHRPDLFDAASGYSGSKAFTDTGGNNYQVDWRFGYVADMGPGVPTGTALTPVSSGTITIGSGNAIQSGAPNPYNGETRISTNYSNPGMTAFELDFTSSATHITAFGIYVGDLESRANNGTNARVILFDMMGGVIGDHPLNTTGTVSSASGTTTYTSVEPLGSPSGTNNNTLIKWGSKTTMFLTIASSQPIGRALIHVGDDDHSNRNTAVQEQLGIAGFTVAMPVIAPDLKASKTVASYVPTAYAVPSEDVIYTLNIRNEGAGTVDTNTLFLTDYLPDEIAFFTGDMDDAGPATGPIQFEETGSGLSFNVLTDVAYSKALTPPSSFADCLDAPTSTYDAAIRYICLRADGAMNAASAGSVPDVSFSFRARVN